MDENDQKNSGSTVSSWSVVLVTVVGFAFVGSVLAVFLIGYFSGPELAPNPDPAIGNPEWRGQIQPGDQIIDMEPGSPPRFEDLIEDTTLTEIDELEMIITRDGQEHAVRIKPGSQGEN